MSCNLFRRRRWKRELLLRLQSTVADEAETVERSSKPLRLRLNPDSEPITIDESFSCGLCSFPIRPHGESDECKCLELPISTIKASALLGCGWCTITWRAISLAWNGLSGYEHFHDIELGTAVIFTKRGRPSTLGRLIWSTRIHHYRLQLSLSPDAGSWGPFPRFVGIEESAASKTSMEFCRERLKHCRENHKACQIEGTYMPTRLLFLQGGQDAIRLIHSRTSSDQVAAPYAALSHPWGDGQHFVLNSENVEAMTEEIPWTDLPRTYMDAIKVCEELGIHYIWIDSLCIKQGDKADWAYEAARMADVYEHAVIVLSASCCSGSNDSFLSPRTPSQGGPVTIAWTDAESDPQPLLQTQMLPLTGFHRKGTKANLIDPLEMRGWAYQERILARRLLDFTSHEIQWVCKKARLCECGKSWGNIVDITGETRGTENDLPMPVLAKNDWFRVVEDYSARKLTYATDKLPALSGLASRFSDAFQLKYIAGMWLDESNAAPSSWTPDEAAELDEWPDYDDYMESDWGTPNFVAQLCWGGEEGWRWKEAQENDEDQEEAYRAPSFSWISSNGTVKFLMKYYKQSFITALDANSSLKHDDPFAEVTDGFLELRCRLVGITMRQPTRKDEPPQIESADGTAISFIQGSKHSYIDLDKPDSMNFFRVRDQDGNRKQRNLLWSTERQPQCRDTLCCYALRLCSELSVTAWLVLMESVRDPDSYERIGIIKTLSHSNGKELGERWEAATEEVIRIV